jgi:2-polyprenyl-6-methoxyphenol hydroxylase-like FAD-dependent oxidoreductase
MQELVLIQPGRTAETDLQRGATEAALRREFEERFAECGPLAFRVARGVLRNTADAEDVAQDAILRAYRRFDKLRDRSRFRAWLVRITFRLALDLVTLDRDDDWQCAYVIPKGGFEAIQKNGLPAFRRDLETVAPFLQGRTIELKDWSDIKLLSVAIDRLRHWSRSGLLCIGDSAHAMSPIGGVGINLAIQDAVGAANILVPALSTGASTDAHLQKVQARREFPTRMTQRFQILAHKRFIGPALATKAPLKRLPLPLALLKHFPILRRIPARMVGLGFRPEHIHTPDSHRANRYPESSRKW